MKESTWDFQISMYMLGLSVDILIIQSCISNESIIIYIDIEYRVNYLDFKIIKHDAQVGVGSTDVQLFNFLAHAGI